MTPQLLLKVRNNLNNKLLFSWITTSKDGIFFHFKIIKSVAAEDQISPVFRQNKEINLCCEIVFSMRVLWWHTDIYIILFEYNESQMAKFSSNEWKSLNQFHLFTDHRILINLLCFALLMWRLKQLKQQW